MTSIGGARSASKPRASSRSRANLVVALLLFQGVLLIPSAHAETYEVGPGLAYENIGDAPLDSLSAGDIVEIHWRSDPYQEKFVIAAQGTEAQPVIIRGIPNDSGDLPVIDGRDATTPDSLNYWNENRGVIKIGGANSPSCDPPGCVPSWIVIENLDVRSGRAPYSYTDDSGSGDTYSDNAASIYIELGRNITIRNCIIRDSGNGLFIGAYDGETEDILIEGNWIYDNGIEDSIYQHNSYTAARGIIFQYNHYGSLRSGCGGNNLKDRSAGLVVRYNWIENGNRQLDLVDGEDTATIPGDSRYAETFVYGNVLIEAEGEGNSQIIHYGGDSGDEDIYRKGTLYFYNNTVVSTRTGNTTLFRLSTNDEHCDARNNIFYTTAGGGSLALCAGNGVLDLSHNWIRSGWVDTHDSLDGTINDDGTSIEGTSPTFEDEGAQDFHLADGSPCVDAGTDLIAAVLPDHDVVMQYLVHQLGETRPVEHPLDIGAYERCLSGDCSGGDGDGDGDADGDGDGDSDGDGDGDGDGDEGCGCRAAGHGRSTGPIAFVMTLIWVVCRRITFHRRR